MQQNPKAPSQIRKTESKLDAYYYSSVYDLTLNTKQDKDHWSNKRVNWINVLMTIGTYALVISDVPHAGAKPQLNLRHIGMGVYAYFGSFSYPLLKYVRDPNDLQNVTGFIGGGQVDSA